MERLPSFPSFLTAATSCPSGPSVAREESTPRTKAAEKKRRRGGGADWLFAVPPSSSRRSEATRLGSACSPLRPLADSAFSFSKPWIRKGAVRRVLAGRSALCLSSSPRRPFLPRLFFRPSAWLLAVALRVAVTVTANHARRLRFVLAGVARMGGRRTHRVAQQPNCKPPPKREEKGLIFWLEGCVFQTKKRKWREQAAILGPSAP
jgi:hypothetical protein